MNTELAAYTPHELDVMADRVAKSGMFGMTQPQAFALLALCQSDGLHPMQAVRRYHIIHNRPAMKADAMLAEFQARGGTVRWGEMTDTAWSGTFYHGVHAPDGNKVRFTIEDANRAELPKSNPNWKKYPANMLRARVISNGIRMTLPGIVAGIYTPEECEDMPPLRATARMPEPAAIEPPADRRPSKADLRAEASLKKTWAIFSTDAIAATNDALHRAFAEAGLPIDPAASACNIHQLHRHLLKWSPTLRSPFPAPAEGGTLHQRDAARLVADWWDTSSPDRRAEIRAEVGRYLKLRVEAHLNAAEGDGPTIDAGPGDEAAEVDEDAILAMGREPGEEG